MNTFFSRYENLGLSQEILTKILYSTDSLQETLEFLDKIKEIITSNSFKNLDFIIHDLEYWTFHIVKKQDGREVQYFILKLLFSIKKFVEIFSETFYELRSFSHLKYFFEKFAFTEPEKFVEIIDIMKRGEAFVRIIPFLPIIRVKNYCRVLFSNKYNLLMNKIEDVNTITNFMSKIAFVHNFWIIIDGETFQPFFSYKNTWFITKPLRCNFAFSFFPYDEELMEIFSSDLKGQKLILKECERNAQCCFNIVHFLLKKKERLYFVEEVARKAAESDILTHLNFNIYSWNSDTFNTLNELFRYLPENLLSLISNELYIKFQLNVLIQMKFLHFFSHLPGMNIKIRNNPFIIVKMDNAFQTKNVGSLIFYDLLGFSYVSDRNLVYLTLNKESNYSRNKLLKMYKYSFFDDINEAEIYEDIMSKSELGLVDICLKLVCEDLRLERFHYNCFNLSFLELFYQ